MAVGDKSMFLHDDIFEGASVDQNGINFVSDINILETEDVGEPFNTLNKSLILSPISSICHHH